MDRRVTPPKRVTSPTWGPPPPCKQALNLGRTRRIYLDLGGDCKGQDHDAYPASCQP